MQVNAVVQAPGSVATGTLSALCFALVLAAGAGAAYYCVKRRRREEQFGYFQVGAGSHVERSRRRGVSRGWEGRHAPPEAPPPAAPPPAAPPIAPLRCQADLRADEEAEEEAVPQGEGTRPEARPRAARLRPQRPLVAIPNPLYRGHAPDYEPLHVSPAPAPPRAPRPRPALTPLSPQDALLSDADGCAH